MQVKNGKIMFCHCCSNADFNGGCIYGKEDRCGITEKRLNEIFHKKLIERLKDCRELPPNFKKFHVA